MKYHKNRLASLLLLPYFFKKKRIGGDGTHVDADQLSRLGIAV